MDSKPHLFCRILKFFTGSGSYPGFVKLYKQVPNDTKLNRKRNLAFSNFQVNFSIFRREKNKKTYINYLKKLKCLN